jgi:hypothetical protein
MMWLQTFSSFSRMTCHSIFIVISILPLMNTLLRMQVCSMRTFSHCAHILIDTRSCPTQSSLRSTLPNISTFMLRLWSGICRKRKRLFLSPTEYFLANSVPYPVSSCLGNHRVFLASLVLSRPSGSSDLLHEDEDDSSYTYGIPLQRWNDQAYCYR